MKCVKCGEEWTAGRSCPRCGAENGAGTPDAQFQKKFSQLAMGSLIFVFFPILSPLACILACVAMKKCDENPNLMGRGVAVAACIISVMEMLLLLGILICCSVADAR